MLSAVCVAFDLSCLFSWLSLDGVTGRVIPMQKSRRPRASTTISIKIQVTAGPAGPGHPRRYAGKHRPYCNPFLLFEQGPP